MAMFSALVLTVIARVLLKFAFVPSAMVVSAFALCIFVIGAGAHEVFLRVGSFSGKYTALVLRGN